MSSPCSLMDFEPAMTASVKGFSLPGIQSKKWPPFGVSTVAWRRSGIRDIVAVELHLRSPADPDRLSGCGMVIVNPPYGFERHARVIADAILGGLGDSEIGAGTAVLRLIDE